VIKVAIPRTTLENLKAYDPRLYAIFEQVYPGHEIPGDISRTGFRMSPLELALIALAVAVVTVSPGLRSLPLEGGPDARQRNRRRSGRLSRFR